jgi:hypothetical protein
LGQLAQLTDDVVRDTNRKEDILGPIKAKFPGWRNTLPANRTVFGETTPTEGWKVLLFGARVKTGRDDVVIQELSRLQDAGQLPSITDVSKTSPRAKELKNQIGADRFEQFQISFGGKFKKGIEQVIRKGEYKRSNDEEKKNTIDKIKNTIFESELKKFHYKKPKK